MNRINYQTAIDRLKAVGLFVFNPNNTRLWVDTEQGGPNVGVLDIEWVSMTVDEDAMNAIIEKSLKIGMN